MLNNKQILTEFFEHLKEDVIKEQQAQGRVASGKSIREYEVQVNDFGGILFGASYVGTLETGRKPGKVPFGFAEIIEDWINDKGIFQNVSIAERGSIAYFIAKKIAEEGTKLHREGGASGILTGIVTQERIKSFTDKLLVSFQNDSIEQILFQFKAA